MTINPTFTIFSSPFRTELSEEVKQLNATSTADDMQVAEFKNEIAMLREQVIRFIYQRD